MPHIPRAVCVPCRIEMRPSRNGIEVEMLLPTGKGYYRIEADEYECGRCGHKAIIGFAHQPFVSHFEPGYAKSESDISAEFAL